MDIPPRSHRYVDAKEKRGIGELNSRTQQYWHETEILISIE
jgi:hypothetical protein